MQLVVVPVCEYSKRYLDSVTGFAYSEKLHRVYNGVEVKEASWLAPIYDGVRPALARVPFACSRWEASLASRDTRR